MKKFLATIVGFFLIWLIPLSILFIGYLILDPFKVLKSYNSFYELNSKPGIALNKDFISTTTLLNNSKKISYNSFIFGNSRSLFYQVSEWNKHLPRNSKCFHFDASGEGIWAIEKKIKFVSQEGMKIKNVLLVLDYSTLIQDKSKSGHLFIISPKLINYSNIIDFHKTFFLAFISPKFLYAYLDYNISGVFKPYMQEGNLLSNRPLNYNIETNEVRFDYFEELIRKNQYYDLNRKSEFYVRDTIKKYSPISINEKQKEMLNNIQKIFERQNTNLKIVISPLYNQEKLNDKDLSYLKLLFGADNVFDYSGINKFTNNYMNYYESSHYRPHVAKEIMEEVYRNK